MHRLPLVLVGLALAALPGCSGGSSASEPATLPPAAPASATSAPSPAKPMATASPAPAGPVMPALAKGNTPQGAAAFARHWYAELVHAYAIRDSTRLAALSDGTCQTCANYEEDVTAARADGTTFRGISIEILYAEAAPLEGAYCTVYVTYDQGAVEVFRPDGTLEQSSPAVRKTDVHFQAKWDSNHWVVARLVEPK